MSTSALLPYEPVSSGEIRAIDFGRVEEVERKHDLLKGYLKLKDLDGLLLRDPANFAWLTCGGDNAHQGNIGPKATAFVNGDARVLLCDSVDSGMLFDRELPGLGFQLKERPWHQCGDRLCQDLSRGRRTGSDTHGIGDVYVGDDLVDFRVRLTEREHQTLRTLGRLVAHAVEATARNLAHGMTEAEVAGHLSHRLIKHEVQPLRIQVMADGQGHRYRRWGYSSDAVERYCVISATGRMRGLHVTATRTMCFDNPPATLRQSHAVATLVQATGIAFSQPGWVMSEIWKRVERIYEKFDAAEEWHQAEQGEVTGYRPSEACITPGSSFTLEEGMVLSWRPSVRASMTGDTMLIRGDSNEVLTPTEHWPRMTVEVKGQPVEYPDILVR
jgi:Xaa-Pro aminopeptidase